MNLYKKYILVSLSILSLLLTGTLGMEACRVGMPEDDRKLVIPASSADSLAVADSLLLTPEGAEPLDSIPADSVASKEKEDVLEAPVSYQADDSIVWIIENSKAYLFKNSKVDYQKIGLTAEQIQVDIDTKTVYAHGVTDSLGVEIGRPVFKDGDTPYESDTMSYNFSSRKGYISNVVTQQGEGYMTSRDAKKGPDNEIYVMGGKYTTCDNHEHPHFYMALTRGKVRPGKNAVFGPAYLVVEDVPLPLAIPFGFFPFSNDKYASGFIMPTYGDELERGFYLRDGGYYFAISDYMDLKLTGEIFTKGSWGLNASSSYNKRY